MEPAIVAEGVDRPSPRIHSLWITLWAIRGTQAFPWRSSLMKPLRNRGISIKSCTWMSDLRADSNCDAQVAKRPGVHKSGQPRRHRACGCASRPCHRPASHFPSCQVSPRPGGTTGYLPPPSKVTQTARAALAPFFFAWPPWGGYATSIPRSAMENGSPCPMIRWSSTRMSIRASALTRVTVMSRSARLGSAMPEG